MNRMQAVVLGAVFVAAMFGAPALGSVVAREDDGASGISAYGDTAVWSSLDMGDGWFRLRLFANGVTRTLKVRPRRVPFDVDLGRDAAGHLTAVYSRCRNEGIDRNAVWEWSHDLTRAEGCDLRLWRIGGRAERKVKFPDYELVNDYMPSLDGNKIAFARPDPNEGGVGAVAPTLQLYDLRTRKLRRLPEGTRGDWSYYGDGDWFGGPGPTGLDLRGDTLAVSWGFGDESCDPSGEGVDTRAEVWLMKLNGSRTLIDRTDCNDRIAYSSPTLTSQAVVYVGGPAELQAVHRFARRTHAVSLGPSGLTSASGSSRVLFATRSAHGRHEVIRTVRPFAH
jgi:hypothetical protein